MTAELFHTKRVIFESKSDHVSIVDYSPKSIAVFGSLNWIQTHAKLLERNGGLWNTHLKYTCESINYVSGFIFAKSNNTTNQFINLLFGQDIMKLVNIKLIDVTINNDIKIKNKLSTIICYTCKEMGHYSFDCSSNYNAVLKQKIKRRYKTPYSRPRSYIPPTNKTKRVIDNQDEIIQQNISDDHVCVIL